MTQPPGSQKDACPSRPKSAPVSTMEERIRTTSLCRKPALQRTGSVHADLVTGFCHCCADFLQNAAHAVHIRNIRAVSAVSSFRRSKWSTPESAARRFSTPALSFPVKRSLPLIQIESTKPPSALSLPYTMAKMPYA